MSARLTPITFGAKMKCPLCNAGFEYEKCYTKKISPKTRDISLRNIYDTATDAHPNPIIYSLVICPNCIFTAFEPDFAEIKAKPADIQEATKSSKALLTAVGRTTFDLTGLRGPQIGLASYYLAEIWYDIQNKSPMRNFRLALTAYRRAWMLDIALDAGLIDEDRFRSERRKALTKAELHYEQSYLGERLKLGTFCGPDYGVDFGDIAMPYLITYSNYVLAKDPALTAAERLGRASKARKFLSIALNAASKSGARELQAKVMELRDLMRYELPSEEEVKAVAEAPAVDAEDASNAEEAVRVVENQFEPRTEFYEWDLHFSMLYKHHGVDYNANDVIVREGDATYEMFFVLEGKVNVIKSYETEPRLLARLGRGAFFGEMSLLDRTPRFATVVASERSRLIRMSQSDLEKIIKTYPSVALRIMSVLAGRIRNYHAFVETHILPLVGQGPSPAEAAPEAAPDAGVIRDEVKPRVHDNATLFLELQGLMQEIAE